MLSITADSDRIRIRFDQHERSRMMTVTDIRHSHTIRHIMLMDPHIHTFMIRASSIVIHFDMNKTTDAIRDMTSTWTHYIGSLDTAISTVDTLHVFMSHLRPLSD